MGPSRPSGHRGGWLALFGIAVDREGEPMRVIRTCLLFTLAALTAFFAAGDAGAAAAKASPGGKQDEGKPTVYVKDGDRYRPATDSEIKAAAGAGTEHDHGGG